MPSIHERFQRSIHPTDSPFLTFDKVLSVYNYKKKKGAFNAPLSIQNKIRLRRTLVKVNPASRKVGAASACLGLSVAITDLAYQAE